MATTGESGISWICPQCSRRVPMRIDTCRCGTPRPAPTTAPAAPASTPPEPSASSVAPVPVHALASRGAGFDESLRSPKEQTLFLIGAIFSGLVWLMLVISIVGVFYGLIGLAFSLMIHALFLAHVRGNALRVSERQLPDVHAAVMRSAQALGLGEVPEVYVAQAGGTLNAFATKFLSRKFVIIYSDLIEACQDPRQLEFVIGHEVGHLAAGHLKWNAFLWPFMLVPLLGMAYSRAREYTCDRCGLAVVNDLEMSMRGLIVLAAGGRQATRADIGAFVEQRLETGHFWSAVAELGSTHPFLCKRVAALQEHTQPGTLAPVPRNPFAYPVAPFLAFGGAAAGGASLLVVVAIIGIIAAIAIPSLLRARVAANESQAIGTVRSVVSAEIAYSQAGGAYGQMPCLLAPARCLAGYTGPAFLAEQIADTQNGYRYGLRLAQDGQGFAFVAEPVAQGKTGVRSFCGDHSGIVCASTEQGLAESSRSGCDMSRCRLLR